MGSALIRCCLQINAEPSGSYAKGCSSGPALHCTGHVTPSHIRHASPRSMKRQLAFLGLPSNSPSPGWNASVHSQVPHPSKDCLSAHLKQAVTAGHLTTAAAATTAATPRNAAVVCKAVGLGKPKVPSLKLAALRAERQHSGVQLPRKKVCLTESTLALDGLIRNASLPPVSFSHVCTNSLSYLSLFCLDRRAGPDVWL